MHCIGTVPTVQDYDRPFTEYILYHLTNLKRGKIMIDEERQSAHRHDEELHAERVVVAIISGLELDVDHVDCGEGTGNVHHLHTGVVHRDKVCEQVQVA